MKGISKRVGVGLLGLMFMLALVSATPVEAKVPQLWEASAVYYGGYGGYPDWYGDVWTEDGLHGIFNWIILDVTFLSNVQHYDSFWWIEWDDGGLVEGTATGKLVYTTTPHYVLDGGDYVFNGKVTYASSDWSYVDGRNVHIMGHVTPYWTTTAVIQIN